MSELDKLVEKGVHYGEKLGAEEIEICLAKGITRNAKSEGLEVRGESKTIEQGSIRVAIGKRVGITYITSLSEELLSDSIKAAIKIAKASEEDPFWQGLPDPEKPIHSWVGYDEGLATLNIQDLIAFVKELVGRASQYDDRIKVARAEVGLGISWEVIANNHGLYAEDKGTNMHAFAYVKGKESNKESTGYGYVVSRSLVIEFEPMIERAIKLARDGLKAVPFKDKYSGPVVLSPEIFASLISHVLIPATLASSVQEGLSPLRGKRNKEVFSKEFTLIDDGTLPGGIRTSLYDGEGVPRRRTVIFEKGVLKSFLYNTYTARRENVRSTGNATRAGTGISPTNLIVSRGSKSREKLISSLDKGIFLDGMLLSVHTVNTVTGDYSVVVTNPYLIRNGDIETPLRQLTFAGNIYRSFKREFTAANDARWTSYSVLTPTVIIGESTLSD